MFPNSINLCMCLSSVVASLWSSPFVSAREQQEDGEVVAQYYLSWSLCRNTDSCDREVSGVSQELHLPALSADGPGEHSVGWRLESEACCATTTARFQCPVGSWALVGTGCLLVCSGLSLKHSSDVLRRRQLKLTGIPTINENKDQMHNFAVLFWMCCEGDDVFCWKKVLERKQAQWQTVTTCQAPRLCPTACWVLVKYPLILMGAALYLAWLLPVCAAVLAAAAKLHISSHH